MCYVWIRRTHWILVLLCVTGARRVVGCPEVCECKDCDVGGRGSSPGAGGNCKMVCRSPSPELSLTAVPDGIPEHVTQIDLSGNALTRITHSDFAGLTSLQKLGLSSNRIKSIESRAFSGLNNLIKLDLSGNGLKSINASLFEGLPKLQKLDLAENDFDSVPEGTFDVLPSLQKIDFKSYRLVCDCRLKWIVRWQKVRDIRVRESTKCVEPEQHHGKSLRDLKKRQFICDEQIDLPYFELSPSTNQVVFEGDKLPFECRASVPDMVAHMMWVRGVQRVIANVSQGINIHQTMSPDHSMLMQSLILERLQVAHSGVWTCFIQTSRGNVSKSVNIVVMSLKATHCPAVVRITSKGTFDWPKTVSGVQTYLPCNTGAAPSYQGEAGPMATYRCTVEGEWKDMDDTQCAYISEVTRKLEAYSRELTNASSVLSKVDSLVSNLTDKMDVVFIARIMETLSKQVKDNEQVGDFLLNAASSLMNVDKEVLRDAQAEDKACTKVVKVLDAVPKELLWDSQKVQKYSDNIAIEAHQVTSKEFDGMTCNWWRPAPSTKRHVTGDLGNNFICTKGTNGTRAGPPREALELEASIHIPEDIFKSVRCIYPLCHERESFYLQFIVFKNAKLFPVVHAKSPGAEYWRRQPTKVPEVITSVISAKIVSFICIAGAFVDNTTSPVVTRLRIPRADSAHKAVYWDFQANDGRGSWLTRGCSVVEEVAGVATIHCNHLTHFGISKDTVVVQSPYDSRESLHHWLRGLFTMSPALYGGSAMLVLCTMTVIITYISGHRYIQMPKKGKHAIANICLCLLLLCLTFTLGIRIGEPIIACRVVGVAIHYFSLAELFWMVILAFTMYKKFVKLLQPAPPPVDPLEEAPPPRSVITCYLIGWGVSIIICGISGAINWKEYAGHSDYCFLTMNAALLTFFAPAGLVIIVVVAFFIRICCILRGSGSRAPLQADEPETEEIQVNEANDADGPAEDLLTTVAAAGTTVVAQDIGSRTVTPTNLDRSELTGSMMDLEHRPINQLRGIALLLLLYVISWTCGALAVSVPFGKAIPHQEIIFNFLYGFSTFVLGVYILAFYCVSRRDCREAWRYCCNKPPKKQECKIEQTPPPMTLQQLSHIQTNGHNGHNGHISHIQSHSSLSSNHTNKSNTISSFNPALYSLQKPSKVNLVPSQTSDPSFASVQDFPLFYNPRQNGIAKKYWEKKHHRNLLSHINKETNADSGHSSNTEGRGGMIYESGRRLSYHGNSSDGNANHSLEIQIPGRNGVILDPRVGGQYTTNPEHLQNIYNSLSRRKQLHSQPMTIDPVTGVPMMLAPIDRHHLPPVLGRVSPHMHMNSGSPIPPNLNPPSPLPPVMENFIPGQSGPNSVTDMSGQPNFNPNQYLLSMVPIDKSRYLPMDSSTPLCNSHRTNTPLNEYMQRNGSVPRLRDFDGQSQVSQAPTAMSECSHKSPFPLGPTVSEASYKSGYPPGPTVSEASYKSPHTLSPTREEPPPKPAKPPHNSHSLPIKENGAIPSMVKDKRSPTPSTQIDKSKVIAESESDVLSDTDPFIKEIKQRIPQNTIQTKSQPTTNGATMSNSDTSSKSKSPSPYRDTNGFTSSDGGVVSGNSRPVSGGSQDGKGSGGDSSSQSKTSCTYSEPTPNGRTPLGRTQRSLSLPKGNKSWNDEYDGNTKHKQPCYAFVNHKYKDRVLQKLLKRNQESGSSLVDSGVSWLPRSVSAYDQVVTTETDTLVEESGTSSTDDSDEDDIWMLNQGKKKKLSQETSV